jgi:hypothetical protein
MLILTLKVPLKVSNLILTKHNFKNLKPKKHFDNILLLKEDKLNFHLFFKIYNLFFLKYGFK